MQHFGYIIIQQPARPVSLARILATPSLCDEREFDVGIHGEPGRRIVKLGAADEVANELINAILSDLEAPEAGPDPVVGLARRPAESPISAMARRRGRRLSE